MYLNPVGLILTDTNYSDPVHLSMNLTSVPFGVHFHLVGHFYLVSILAIPCGVPIEVITSLLLDYTYDLVLPFVIHCVP